MVTIGDGFSVVATILGICVSAWALIMFFTLFFQRGVALARAEFSRSLLAPVAVGVLLLATVGLFAVIASAAPVPGSKLLGLAAYLLLMSLSAFGLTGLVSLISDRIRLMEPGLTVYGAHSRAAFIVVIAGLFPVLGWFLVGPLTIIASLGAGAISCVRRVSDRASAQSIA